MYPMQTPEYAESASVFNITERNFLYDPLLNDTFHWHDYFEMEFFCEGEGTHMLNGKPHAINRGSIYLLTPSDFHTLYRKAEDVKNAKRCLLDALFYYPQNSAATARLKALG